MVGASLLSASLIVHHRARRLHEFEQIFVDGRIQFFVIEYEINHGAVLSLDRKLLNAEGRPWRERYLAVLQLVGLRHHGNRSIRISGAERSKIPIEIQLAQ